MQFNSTYLKSIKTKLILLILLAGSALVYAQDSQDACKVFLGETSFSHSTFNAPVITDASGPISIINNYSTPSEDLKAINQFLELLITLNKDPNLSALPPEKQIKYLQDQINTYKEEQKELNAVRQGVAIEQAAIENSKTDFLQEIQQEAASLRNLLSSLSDKNLNDLMAKEVEQIKFRSEKIIESANNCLSKDFELTTIQDSESGNLIYGYSLEAIKNDPNYLLVEEYYDGLARVKRNNKYGFYNVKGELVIPFKYDHAENFRDGFSIVKNIGRWYLIDTAGNIETSFPRSVTKVTFWNKNILMITDTILLSYLSTTDEKKINNHYYHQISPLIKGRAVVQARPNGTLGNKKYGLLNETGEEIIPCLYDSIAPFNEDRKSVV